MTKWRCQASSPSQFPSLFEGLFWGLRGLLGELMMVARLLMAVISHFRGFYEGLKNRPVCAVLFFYIRRAYSCEASESCFLHIYAASVFSVYCEYILHSAWWLALKDGKTLAMFMTISFGGNFLESP